MDEISSKNISRVQLARLSPLSQDLCEVVMALNRLCCPRLCFSSCEQWMRSQSCNLVIQGRVRVLEGIWVETEHQNWKTGKVLGNQSARLSHRVSYMPQFQYIRNLYQLAVNYNDMGKRSIMHPFHSVPLSRQ